MSPETSDEFQQLREQLSRYEASLQSAKGRLEAFARLEQIAKDRHQSPEVVAARAAVELLEGKEGRLRDDVEALESHRDAIKEELSMLLVNKKQTIIDLEEVRVNREGLADDVAGILNEIDSMRADARRLQKEKGELETQVMELRLVVAELERKEAGLQPNQGRRDTDVDGDVEAEALSSAEIAVGMDADDSEAFDRFFNAGDVDDKARDWMLG